MTMPVDMLRRNIIGALGAVAVLMALAGCATSPAVPSAPASGTGPWSGRLALTVETQPPRHFYAGFTLQGNADTGQLALTSPLGNTLAALRWQPGRAELIQGSQVQTYASLDNLTAHVTGAPLPVPALFDWLHGRNTTIDGWQADLSALTQGKLKAQRLSPNPAVQLRIALIAE
jgi:outer membrane lipoprotein LolB